MTTRPPEEFVRLARGFAGWIDDDPVLGQKLVEEIASLLSHVVAEREAAVRERCIEVVKLYCDEGLRGYILPAIRRERS